MERPNEFSLGASKWPEGVEDQYSTETENSAFAYDRFLALTNNKHNWRDLSIQGHL